MCIFYINISVLLLNETLILYAYNINVQYISICIQAYVYVQVVILYKYWTVYECMNVQRLD